MGLTGMQVPGSDVWCGPLFGVCPRTQLVLRCCSLDVHQACSAETASYRPRKERGQRGVAGQLGKPLCPEERGAETRTAEGLMQDVQSPRAHDEPESIRKQINRHVCPHGGRLLAIEGTECRHPLPSLWHGST